MRALHHAGVLVVLLMSGAPGASSVGQSRPISPIDDVVGKHIRVRPDRDARPAVPGAKLALFADVTPGPKIHVYAPGQPGYIAVELTTDPATAFKSLAPKYPPAVDYYFEPLRETVKVYDKPFRITQEVALATTPDLRRRAAAREQLTITGTLSYQACDDAVCYRSESLTITWKILLQPGR